MTVRFVRKHNRTVKDIFGNKFQQTVKMQLQDATQKIAFYCKRNHSWQNRTGALEESINFTPAERKGTFWQSSVFAGGWAKVKYAYDFARRRATRRKKANIRYQRGQRFKAKRGMGIYVNYAYWVEKKGFPVLKQGIEKYRRRLAGIFKANLRVRRFTA